MHRRLPLALAFLLATGTLAVTAPSGAVEPDQTDVLASYTTGISAGADLTDMAPGFDGNLWFTEKATNKVGFITTGGTVSEGVTALSAGASPTAIAPGGNGNVWFLEPGVNKVAQVTPAGPCPSTRSPRPARV